MSHTETRYTTIPENSRELGNVLSYIVRYSSETNQHFVLSYLQGNRCSHVLIQNSEFGYYFPDIKTTRNYFPTLVHLLQSIENKLNITITNDVNEWSNILTKGRSSTITSRYALLMDGVDSNVDQSFSNMDSVVEGDEEQTSPAPRGLKPLKIDEQATSSFQLSPSHPMVSIPNNASGSNSGHNSTHNSRRPSGINASLIESNEPAEFPMSPHPSRQLMNLDPETPARENNAPERAMSVYELDPAQVKEESENEQQRQMESMSIEPPEQKQQKSCCHIM
jgi:hypothetical protein